MSADLAAKAAELSKRINPANGPVATSARIPLTQSQQKLAVDDIPGYHLHWMLGRPDRLAAARRAGYEFVRRDEVQANDLSLGGDGLKNGSTDVGDLVSVIAGGEIGVDGQPVRLYLMKQKLEYYLADQKLLEQQSDKTVAMITGGMVGADKDGRGDADHRYVDRARTVLPDMFKKKASS